MSNATDDHIRDARRAHGELAVSLQILGDLLSTAQTALHYQHNRAAAAALVGVGNELAAAHEYLAAARDACRTLEKAAA